MGRRENVVRLAHGPVVVAAGAAVLGVFSYVYLSVAARHLGPAEFGELSALWAVLFSFVAGLWYPFEQELTRLVASAEQTVSSADLRRVAGVQAAALLAAEVVAGVVALRSDSLFGGVGGLGVALLVSVLSLGIAGFQRGRLLGARRFGWVATQQAVDGSARAIGAVACVLTGASVGTFGLVLAFAPFLGILAALPGTPASAAHAPATRSWGRVVRDLLALLAGSFIAIVLINVGPLAVRFLSGPEATGRFMAVFVVARLPLYFAGAVVAGLLPAFVDARRSPDPTRFPRVVRNVTAAVGGLAFVGCLVLGVLGPWISRVFFGSAYSADETTSVVLALSSAGLTVALILQGALVAEDRQRAVAWTWACGAAAFGAALLLPWESGLRVATAYLAAAIVTVVAMLATLGLSRTRSAVL